MGGSIDALRLREVLAYDPETGEFRWRLTASNRRVAGSLAGTVAGGRGVIGIDGRKYLAHRLAWLYVHGSMAPLIDHVNGQTTDNRISNLRPATPAGNQQNQRATGRRSSTGLLGASLNRKSGRYYGFIKSNGHSNFLGSYETAEEAHEAYLAAKAQVHTFQPVPRAS